MAAATALGYVRNALARSLITRRSNLIGVVITQYTMRGNPDVIYAIGAQLAAAGKQLLLVTVEDDGATLDALQSVLEYPIEALISCVCIPRHDLRHLLARRLPIVFYNRSPDGEAADSVATDHAAASSAMATALHAAGHRRFLCLGGPEDAPVSRQRLAGFAEGLRQLGSGVEDVLVTDYSYAAAYAVFLARMRPSTGEARARPDAVFCANDQLAMGVMDACRFDLGWNVPGDLSVVGFDDIAEAARPVYELTTMHQDSVALAREAVRLMLLRLSHPHSPPAHVPVPATMIRRHSARLGASDPAIG